MAKLQEINAYAILINDGKILVLKRPNSIWEFPGGGVEWGEHPADAAKRETQEETEIKADNLVLIGVTSASYKKEGQDKHSIYLVYTAKVSDNKFKISGEHLEGKWVTIKELKTMNLGLNAKSCIDFI